MAIIVNGGGGKHRGVKLSRYGKWQAQIKIDGHTLHLGMFAFEADAALAYNTQVAWRGFDRPLNTITEDMWNHD